MRRNVVACAASALLSVACAALPPPPPAPEAAACVPSFPYRDGWLGGDAAYSVRLDAERTVWIFGDSFVWADAEPPAAEAPRQRTEEQLLFGNTIAISTCTTDGSWEIEYHFGARGERRARSFFAPPWSRDTPHFYWPLDGFVHDGVLYVGLLEVSTDWTLHGTALARVDNPHDSPAEWRVAYVRMSEHPSVFPGFSMVVADGYVHMFASIVRGAEPRRRVLTRLPLSEVVRRAEVGESLESAFATYARDGTWTPGLSPADEGILMQDSATEMSVRFHPAIGRWVAIYVELAPFGSGAISYRTAEELTGPWSAPELLYTIPEVTRGSERFDPDTVCYAGKEHAEFRAAAAGATPVLITYVCNSLSVEKLYRNLELYRPVVLRDAFELRLPSSAAR